VNRSLEIVTALLGVLGQEAAHQATEETARRSTNWWLLLPVPVIGMALWAREAWDTWFNCGRIGCPHRRNRWHTHRHRSPR
jgi:hypothetical protein